MFPPLPERQPDHQNDEGRAAGNFDVEGIVDPILAGFRIVDRAQDAHLGQHVGQRRAVTDQRAAEQTLQRFAKLFGSEGIAEYLLHDATRGVDYADLQGVVVADWRGHEAETKAA